MAKSDQEKAETEELTLGRRVTEESGELWDPSLGDQQNEFEQQFLMNKAVFQEASKQMAIENQIEEIPLEGNQAWQK